MATEPQDDNPNETKDEKLLREIREDYSYFRDFWRENYEEAKTDLRFISGDPWEPNDRKLREDNGRPVLCPDELDQYLNQAINNVRQNPISIKIEPASEGAEDQDAVTRSAIISGIEYQSNAQSAYNNAFSCAINCGFGFFRITTQVTGKDGEQSPRIKILGNPLSVLLDPNAKELDFSDQKRCFLFDVMRKSDFGRRYPKAQKKSFTADDSTAAPGWFDGDNIVVAEYWRIDGYDENGKDGKVTQYITNGVEILDTTPWLGSWIPIIPVLGKELYVPRGGEMTRMFYSMIRKARGAQMMLAYIASQEAEEYGMAPRAPFVGYVGQFETDKDAWTTLNKVPRAFVQVDPQTDMGGGAPLPLPTRPAFTPNAQAYELGKESWRRSIQSSMGIMPLPTAAQEQNQKSGIALQRIETQQSVGAYHFTANLKLSLQYGGKQLNELITKIMDTPRHVGIRNADETHSLLPVAPGGQMPEGAQPDDQPFDPTKGEFDVTISTGPSYQSQREEASSFVDLLVQELDQLPVAPQAKATLLAKAIKLKDLGPIGDEISKILDPTGDGEPIPPQAQQAIAQLHQQIQQLTELGQQQQAKIMSLEFEKQAKVVDNQGKFAIQKLQIEAALAEAEINTKAQSLSERMDFVGDLLKQLVGQQHEAALQATGAQQGMQQQTQQQQATSQQSAQEAAQQQLAAQQQPEATGGQ